MDEMKTPKSQSSAARDATPIRTHSPYSEAKGPIVDRGYVEARVRAIEGAYKQLWAPPTSEPREVYPLPEWKFKASELRAASGTPTMSQYRYLSTDPFLDSYNQAAQGQKKGLARGAPQPRKSLQHLPHMTRLNHDLHAGDRKSQSLADLRSRYDASPLQGKRRRKLSNIGTTTSTEPGILSPQPVSPSRLPVPHKTVDLDESSDQGPVHRAALGLEQGSQRLGSMSIPQKSIAEGLGEMVSDNPNIEHYTIDRSTAWESEDYMEYPTPLPSPSEGHPWSTVANKPSESDQSLHLRRMRPLHKVPENTMESSVIARSSTAGTALSLVESPLSRSHNQDDRPTTSLRRALTMRAPRRKSSISTWRTKLRSLSFDHLGKKRQQSSPNIETSRQPAQTSNAESELGFDRLRKTDGERNGSLSEARFSKSRQSSNASANASGSASRALKNAWRKWSGWRLSSAERPSDIAESQEPETAAKEADPEMHTSDSSSNKEEVENIPAAASTASAIEIPAPQTPRRPSTLRRICSHSSLNPSAARSTTALSPPHEIEWTPSVPHSSRNSILASRPSVPSLQQTSPAWTKPSLHHARSAASVVPGPSVTQSPERRVVYHHAASPAIMSTVAEHRKESTSSTSTGSTYHSFHPMRKGSRHSMRSPWRERDVGHWQAEIPLETIESADNAGNRDRAGKEGRKQGIRRVKVVVSLDGAGDLMVDTRVQQPNIGQQQGKVKSFVKRWEAASD